MDAKEEPKLYREGNSDKSKPKTVELKGPGSNCD